MKIKPNDPAQPCRIEEYSGNAMLGDALVYKPGIDIRTHIAAMAMHGLLMAQYSGTYENIPKIAVEYADALINELNKGK